MNRGPNHNIKQAMVVSALLGVMFSAVLVNVLHARAQVFFETEFERTGLGEDGPYSEICGAQFDQYLLSSRVWENRVSNFARELLDNITSVTLDYVQCNAGGAFGSLLGTAVGAFTGGVGSGLVSGIIPKGPDCSIKLNEYEAAAQDAAARTLTYDILTRCTSGVMFEHVTDHAVTIAQQAGPDGGPTWQQDFHDVAPDATQVALLKARNTFANTNWCPEIQDELEVLLHFDADDAYPLDARTDTAGTTFTQEMSCKRDAPLSELDGDPTWAYRASLPENDLAFAYVLAKQHESARIAYEIETAELELQTGQGFRGIRGPSPEESCIRFDQGVCVEYDTIKVPGAVVLENLSNANEASYDWIISSDKMGETMFDLQPRMNTLAQDLTTPVLALDYELDLATERYQDTDPGTPEENRPEQSGDCGQPSQTQCTCHANPGDPNHAEAQSLARNLVANAVGQTELTNPQLFVNNVLPRENFAPFVTQVCFTLGLSSNGCRPYTNRTPPADDVLIFPAGSVEYAIDIIRADGTPRRAPTNKFSCTTGVLP